MEFDLFSGEKRFNLDGPDNRSTWSDECRIIYRNKRQFRGGSVMVWGIILPDGYAHPKKIDGTLTAQKFIILSSRVIPKLDGEFGPEKYRF